MATTRPATEETPMRTTLSRGFARRAALVLLAALAGLGSLALTAAPAQAAASWQWQYDHGLGCWNAATYDGNGNGSAEVIWVDVNRDCRLDSVAFDTNGNDNLLEQLWSDPNGDGRWDVVFVDTNQAVGFDYYFVDRDGNGTWETHGWLAYLQVPTSTGYVSATALVPGPSTSSGAFGNLMLTMAAMTGRAV